MNTRTISVLVLAATLSALAFTSLSAAPQTGSAIGYWASKITVNSWDIMRETSRSETISPGTTRATVLALLGKPLQELSPDVYRYDNCQPDQYLASAQGCNTLIITFAEGRVADIKFVNDHGTAVIAANLTDQRTLRDASGSGPTISAGLAVPST